MERTYNSGSLRSHHVSIDEIVEVLQSNLTIPLSHEKMPNGAERLIWVGNTFNLRLLEIGLEYGTDGAEHVFNAEEASKDSQQSFQECKNIAHSKKEFPARVEQLIAETRKNARLELINSKRLLLRIDSENMELLLEAADNQRTGLAVLARMWLLERLRAEMALASKPNGDPILELHERLTALENKLSRFDY